MSNTKPKFTEGHEFPDVEANVPAERASFLLQEAQACVDDTSPEDLAAMSGQRVISFDDPDGIPVEPAQLTNSAYRGSTQTVICAQVSEKRESAQRAAEMEKNVEIQNLETYRQEHAKTVYEFKRDVSKAESWWGDDLSGRKSESNSWAFLRRLRSRAAMSNTLWLTFFLAVISSAVGVYMFVVWGGFHVNGDGALTNGNGGVVQVASSETVIAADGTWRTRSNESTFVATKKVESWSSLVDLPMQSLEFFEHLQRISIHVDRHVELYSITGYKWFNVSYMELETTRNRDIVIAAGQAFIRDQSSSEIKHMVRPANEPQCGRRLSQAASRQPRAYSWASLVSQYHSEIETSATGRKWRRLDEEADGGQTDMLEWFGALISSEVAVEEARAQASAAAQASYCDYNTKGLECKAYKGSIDVQPPKLSKSGYMRFTVRESGQESLPSTGQLMHFYIDISDFARGRADPQVRQKLASRVTLSDINVSMGGAPPWLDITEFIGSDAYHYEMPHPAAWPDVYNRNTSGADDQGYALATALLESDDHANLKSNCNHDEFMNQDDGPEVQKQTADEVDFNCDDGLFTWVLGGWRVQTYANGTIVAFVVEDHTNGSDTIRRLKVEGYADGGDDERNPILAQAFQHGLIFGGCQPDQVQARDRRLSAWTDFQAGVSGTNWCGAGSDINSLPCPSSHSGDNLGMSNYDRMADWACRRHDHCSRHASVLGGAAVRLSCKCDRDLAQATSNWAVQAVFGQYGAATAWGCFNKENYKYWGSRRRWGPHRKTRFGEKTRYGWGRYDGSLHNYGLEPYAQYCSGSPLR